MVIPEHRTKKHTKNKVYPETNKKHTENKLKHKNTQKKIEEIKKKEIHFYLIQNFHISDISHHLSI